MRAFTIWAMAAGMVLVLGLCMAPEGWAQEETDDNPEMVGQLAPAPGTLKLGTTPATRKIVPTAAVDLPGNEEGEDSDAPPSPLKRGMRPAGATPPAVFEATDTVAPAPPGKTTGVHGDTAASPPPAGSRGTTAASAAPGSQPPVPAPPIARPDASDSPQMGNVEGERRVFTEFETGVMYHIDFYEQDLIEFIKQMSEKFKVNFILSDKVKGGKVTIISPNPVTREEAWQAFLSALAARELTLVRIGKFYKIIPTREAQQSPIKTYLRGGAADPSEEVITYLLKLKHLQVTDVERILKDMKSKDGQIITFEPTNTLLITDAAINIRRMIKIVTELDLPSGRDSIHVIDIYYASAEDVADKLQQIFGARSGNQATPRGGSPRARGRGTPEPVSTDTSLVTITNIIADERTNQLIIVAPRDAMPRIVDMINRLDVPIPGDGQVHVYYLENANSEELAQTLTGLAGRGAGGATRAKGAKGAAGAAGAQADLFEGEVRITADKATNSLVIVASAKDFNSLKRVIRQLDIRRRQVFVEAVIMEVTLKKDSATGVAMNAGYTFDIGGEKVPIFAGTTLGSMSSVVLDPTTLSGMAVGLRGPELEGTAGMLGQGISLPAFGVLLQMLQTDSDANVLSTPHILTMDNEEAEIIVGSNVPFITGQARDANNRPVLSIQRQDVALTMKIKPQINESDFVRLQIQQEITELVSISETLGPTTTKRAAKSTVVVKDNQTIVIGGLIRDRQTADAEKVPFLGDIPILGRLFRRDKNLKEKTNLLIFLTPHIVKDDDDFRRIFSRKMKERREFLQRFYGTDDSFEFEVDYSQKTGLLETIRTTYEEQDAARRQREKESEELVIIPEGGRKAYEVGAVSSGEGTSGSPDNPPTERREEQDADALMLRMINRSED